jgi:hypothetical protein
LERNGKYRLKNQFGTQELRKGNREQGYTGSHQEFNLPVGTKGIPTDQMHEKSVPSVPEYLSFTLIPAVLRASA